MKEGKGENRENLELDRTKTKRFPDSTSFVSWWVGLQHAYKGLVGAAGQ